jgi:hypothetical protein
MDGIGWRSGRGSILLGYGVWMLILLVNGLGSVSGNVNVIGITPLISLRAAAEGVVTIWATSTAGVALVVDGFAPKSSVKAVLNRRLVGNWLSLPGIGATS